MSPLLVIEDLTVQVNNFSGGPGGAAAVDRVSLSLDRGETLGIVGESGCGKTMTAKAIVGLLPEGQARVTRGAIKLAGEELIGASEKRMRQIRGAKIAMIFQEPMTALNPVLTVGYQITEAIAQHRDLGRAQRRALAIEMLGRVRMPSPDVRIDDYPHQLSGGMRQRVMIAMALCLNPDVLIADEPTTALDVTVQAEILELIAELRRERGTAVLLITHDLGVVAEVCDRVVVMYAGQIIEEGSIDEIFGRPRHPYTAGLLRSIPRRGGAGRLAAIPGVVPDLHRLPPACRFEDRCEKRAERCAKEAPLLTNGVRCHFPNQGSS